MTAYANNELIPSSHFAKKFGSYLLQIQKHSIDKLAILKNNKIEAVLVRKDDYEAMNEALMTLEKQQLLESISKGLDDVKKGNTHNIKTLWDKLDNDKI